MNYGEAGIFESDEPLFDGFSLLQDKAYYYLYVEFDDENGKYYPIEEGLQLVQGIVFDGDEYYAAFWDLIEIVDEDFTWNLEDSELDNSESGEQTGENTNTNTNTGVNNTNTNVNNNTNNNATVNNTNEVDNTTSTGKLPQTGKEVGFVLLIASLFTMGVFAYSKYNKFRDI